MMETMAYGRRAGRGRERWKRMGNKGKGGQHTREVFATSGTSALSEEGAMMGERGIGEVGDFVSVESPRADCPSGLVNAMLAWVRIRVSEQMVAVESMSAGGGIRYPSVESDRKRGVPKAV